MNIPKQHPVKWGVVGTGKIAEDFCIAIKYSKLDHKVVAVSSRNLDKAKTFASKFDIEAYYDKSIELFANPEIDLVYIGTVTSDHYESTLQALQSGKPVLCEKPLTVNLIQCKHILEYAKSKNILLIEGLWSRFLPTYDVLREKLMNKTVGDISLLKIKFGLKFDWDSDIQITKKDLGGGTTLGLGCYALHLACIVFNSEKPQQVVASGKLKYGLDQEVEIKLIYATGSVALISLSTTSDYKNDAVVTGSKGSITLTDFWCCEKITVCNETSVHAIPEYEMKTNYPKTCGFVYEIEQAEKSLIQNEFQVPQATHTDSLLVAEITDKIFTQLGIFYD